jgi:hypothetical protein
MWRLGVSGLSWWGGLLGKCVGKKEKVLYLLDITDVGALGTEGILRGLGRRMNFLGGDDKCCGGLGLALKGCSTN